MRPVSLRARLTAGFAVAAAVMLVAAGLVIFLLFSSGITASIDAGLARRAATVSVITREEPSPRGALADSEERLLQIYAPDGRRLASSRRLARRRLLTPAQVARARRGTFSFDDHAVDARIRAFPVRDGRSVAALGEPLDRYRDLRVRLGILLVVTMAVAVVVASFLGFRLAGAALAPVERMRRRAAAITDSDLEHRLPVPGSDDEIARLGRTFNALLDRLSAALHRERRLVADASHELRTPLAVLRAELEVATRRERTPEQMSAAVASALEETERLSRLADDLLLLARSDQGRVPLRPEPVEVLDLVEDARRRNAASAAAGGRELRADVDIPGGAVVMADPDRLAQLLDNLIANALRHGDGPVDVLARLGADDTVEIAVRDHGPGFGDVLPRAFERFSQGEGDRGGSGLGLAIVDAIARAHGGAARATDLPAGGAEVRVVLPAA